MNLGDDDPDLQLLSNSFPTGTPRVEKRDGHYLLILESDEPRDDEAVLADGTNVLHQMVGIMLKDGPNFHRPRIRGMTKQNADEHYCMNVETTTYRDLVSKVAKLEKSCGGNTTLTDIPSTIRDYIQPTDGNVQYFSVDCNTSAKKLPVVVTVGSNLSQGPNRLPSNSPSGLIPFRPFVESNLNQWRSSLNKVFELYRLKNI